LTESGTVIELPKPLNDLVANIVEAMKRKEAVILMREDDALTTQEAAKFLGLSRQFFVRLLGEGKIPHHRVGTHRRVYFNDLVTYQRERSRARKDTLDKMTEDLVDAGVFDRFVPLEREPGR